MRKLIHPTKAGFVQIGTVLIKPTRRVGKPKRIHQRGYFRDDVAA